jgi:hypothetical protein
MQSWSHSGRAGKENLPWPEAVPKNVSPAAGLCWTEKSNVQDNWCHTLPFDGSCEILQEVA